MGTGQNVRSFSSRHVGQGEKGREISRGRSNSESNPDAQKAVPNHRSIFGRRFSSSERYLHHLSKEQGNTLNQGSSGKAVMFRRSHTTDGNNLARTYSDNDKNQARGHNRSRSSSRPKNHEGKDIKPSSKKNPPSQKTSPSKEDADHAQTKTTCQNKKSSAKQTFQHNNAPITSSANKGNTKLQPTITSNAKPNKKAMKDRRYEVPFNPATGMCNYHPNVVLAVKNPTGGWKMVKDTCPKCVG